MDAFKATHLHAHRFAAGAFRIERFLVAREKRV